MAKDRGFLLGRANLGDTVHLRTASTGKGIHTKATLLKIHDRQKGSVNLQVGDSVVKGAVPGRTKGTWHWPE